jgi:hypothetical protein
MELPTVSPIGLVQNPDEFGQAPRRHSAGRRFLAAALLAVVAVVTVLTTVASLGSYCLTTEPGDVRALPTVLTHHLAPPR